MFSGGQDWAEGISRGLSDLRQGVIQGRELQYVEENRQKAAKVMETEMASNKRQAAWIRKSTALMSDGESDRTYAFADAIESGQAKIADWDKFRDPTFAPRDPTETINAQLMKKQMDLIAKLPTLSGDEREVAAIQLQGYGVMSNHTYAYDYAGKAAAPINMANERAKSVWADLAQRNVLKATGEKYFVDDAEIADLRKGIIPQRVLEAGAIELRTIPKNEIPLYQAAQAHIIGMSTKDRLAAIKKKSFAIPRLNEKGEEDNIAVSFESYPALKQFAMTWAMDDEVMQLSLDNEIATQKDMDEYTLGKAGAAEKMRQRVEEMRKQEEEQANKPSMMERIRETTGKVSKAFGGLREAVSGEAEPTEPGVFEEEAAKAQTIGDLLSPATQTRVAGRVAGKGVAAVEKTVGEQVGALKGVPAAMKGVPAAISKAVKSFLSTPLKSSTADIVKSRKKIATTYGSDIKAAADKYGVDADLVVRLIQAESNGNPNAVSPVGARGLMQVMPDTAKGLGVDITTTKGQIEAGVKYLAELLEKTGGDQVRAVAAYNAGPGWLKKDAWMKIPETRNHIKKVFARNDIGRAVAPNPPIELPMPISKLRLG